MLSVSQGNLFGAVNHSMQGRTFCVGANRHIEQSEFFKTEIERSLILLGKFIGVQFKSPFGSSPYDMVIAEL